MSMIETYSSINNLTIYHVDLDYGFQFLIGSPDELLEEHLQWIEWFHPPRYSAEERGFGVEGRVSR